MGDGSGPVMVRGRLKSKLQLLGSHLVLPSAAKQESRASSCTYICLKAGTGELDFSMVLKIVTNEFLFPRILRLLSITSVGNWRVDESLHMLSVRSQPQPCA